MSLVVISENNTIDVSDETSSLDAFEDSTPETYISLEGIPGPPGPGSLSQIYQQTSASASWHFSHIIGRIPQIQVFDANNIVMYPDIQADNNYVTLTFAVPNVGSVLLT